MTATTSSSSLDILNIATLPERTRLILYSTDGERYEIRLHQIVPEHMGRYATLLSTPGSVNDPEHRAFIIILPRGCRYDYQRTTHLTPEAKITIWTQSLAESDTTGKPVA